jgi:glutamate racemase
MSTLLHGPIGLFDSGLGGLTVLKELHRALPTEGYVYLGDNARFPYGTKGRDTIVRYARECAHFLLSQEVKIVIVACNTASAAALAALESELSVPVIGTVRPAVREAIACTKGGKVGVLGTNATIASGVYEHALHAADSSLQIVSQPCPLFVPLVEAGMLEGEIVDKVVELYLTPMRNAGVDSVILGCTHYPLLRDSIQKFMGPDVCIVECSRAIASDVRAMLGAESQNSAPAVTRYFVTDEVSKFNYLATAFLGGREVEAVRVENL